MRNYLLIHFITCLIPALVVVYLYHFVIRGQNGLAFIYLSVIALFFLCILSGIIGTIYSHSMWIPAAINCGVVLIAMILLGQASVMMLVLPVGIVTFLCSFFTWLIIYGSSGIFLPKIYTLLFALLLMAGIYVFFAFINGPVHRGDSSSFFHTEETNVRCEQVIPSREQYEDYLQYAGSLKVGKWIEQNFSSVYSSTLLMNKNGMPYSGKLYLYSPKLKINPLPRKKEVLLYYIDGFLWGYSYGETHLPTEYTDRALLHLPGMPTSLPYLIDKTYEKKALAALSLGGENTIVCLITGYWL
ncbi:MAG: hypothetical protein LUE93_06950 [Bacteroides sp.]|nr:hypothetical protein [Bacteroides sp.]